MQRLYLRAALLGATLAGTAARAFAEEPGYGRPPDLSLDGHRSDFLFNLTTVSITILFFIMVGILLWASLVHRDGKNKAHYEHGVGTKHLILTAIISSVIFFGVDGPLLGFSFRDLNAAFFKYPTQAEKPVTVEVFAQQWAWNFRYPGTDGKFNTADDVVTLNDMHIPVGKPVLIKLRSKDVIHSFYLPHFRTKQDAVPGATTQLWFQAKDAGKVEIGCAQHCGVSHYKMRGWLTVESPEQYNQWLKSEEAAAQRRYDEADAEAHWGWDFWETKDNG
jgi:cytochrome c oxidase subunit 2